MTGLKNLSTQRLLKLLDTKRMLLSRLMKEKYELDYDITEEEIGVLKNMVRDIKNVLSTRDHYSRGATGRKTRQLAKQSR